MNKFREEESYFINIYELATESFKARSGLFTVTELNKRIINDDKLNFTKAVLILYIL